MKYLKIMYVSSYYKLNIMYVIFVFFILKINVHCNFKREMMKIFNRHVSSMITHQVTDKERN